MKTNIHFFDHITILLRMRNVLDIHYGENKKTFLCTVTFFYFAKIVPFIR